MDSDVSVRDPAADPFAGAEALLAQLGAAGWTTDRSGTVVFVFGTLAEAIGVIPGVSVDDLFMGADDVLDAHRTALGGVAASCRHDRSTASWALTVRPLADGAGQLIGSVSVAVAATARGEHTRQLGRSESQLRTLVENLPLAAYMAPLSKVYDPLYISPRVQETVGIPPEEFTFLELRNRIHPADRERALAAFDEADEKALPLSVEYRLVRPDGTVADISDCSSVSEVGGEWVAHGYLLDVTERRRMERDLLQAEQHYRLLIENLPLVIYTRTLDPDSSTGRALFMSGHVEALLEIPPHEAQPGRVREMIHPDDVARVAPIYDEANRDRLPLSLDYRLVTPSGRTVWVHDESRVVLDDAGRPLHVQGYLLDITATQETEAARRRGDERYRGLVENAPLCTYRQRPDATLTYISDHVEQITGVTPEEWLSRPAEVFAELLHPDDRQGVLEEVTRCRRAGETFAMEYRMVSRDRRIVWCLDRTVPVSGDNGELVFRQGFLMDITAEKRREEEARQLQKMDALGQLAGGVAHDFNNLLTAIIGYGELATASAAGVAGSENVRAPIAEMQRAARRAADLTQQLLAFSRRQVMHKRPLDVAEVVEGALRLLRRLIPESITISADIAAGLATVEADPAQLEQVIVNLALNARDAMPDGGQLTLTACERELSPVEAADLHIAPAAYVVVAVTDTGTGITDEDGAHIFEPFFTTKPVGAGTGLGLSTAQGVAVQSGGTIAFESDGASGSTFSVYLPAAGGSPTVEVDTRPAARGGAGERILLVEDEQTLRDLFVTTLTGSGYDVTVACDGAEALTIVESEEFDLLITDVVMPKASGVEVARAVRRRGDTPVVFISGYSFPVMDESELAGTSSILLSKPFDLHELVDAARKTLDGARPAPRG